MTHKLALVLYNRSEEIVGTLTGSILGVIAHKTFADVLLTFLIAIVTGFLGAAGAYSWKLFVKYLKSKSII